MAKSATGRKKETPVSGRKRRFMAALRLAGLTQTTWGKANGVTQGHLSQVLSGRRSKRLEALIDAFSAQYVEAA